VVAKALQRGDRRHRHGGRLLKRQLGGLGRHDVHWHRGVFGEAPVPVVKEIGIDLIARLEPGDAAAGRLDLPGNVYAEDLVLGPQQPQGGAREQGLAAHYMPVRGVDRRCQDLHQDFPGGRNWGVDLRHPQCLRRAVPVIDECLYG
jgi:hypothetical protein